MEKTSGRACLKCGGRLIARCRACHKTRSTCRNEYCTGEAELCCTECGLLFGMGKVENELPPPPATAD